MKHIHPIWVIIMLLIALAAGVLFGGASIHSPEAKADQPKVEYIYVPPVYVPYPVKEVIRTEVIKVEIEYIGIGELRQWEDLYKLNTWLRNNDISEREYIRDKYDCDDFARDLVLAAIADGYWMGLSRISDERHRKTFTDIGNKTYEIEPQDDQVKRVGRVD